MDLLDKHFISVGTLDIRDELMIPVQRTFDPSSFKPKKGLWATIYRGENGNVCEWLNLLQSNAYYRSFYYSQAVVFKLKSTSKICVIDSEEKIKMLSLKYSSLHHLIHYINQGIEAKKYPINYEKLLDDYDAAYINLDSLPKTMLEYGGEFEGYDVNTLLLSNTNCIDYYMSVKLRRDMDYNYESTIIGDRKEVLPRNSEFDYLFEEVKNHVIRFLPTTNTYSSDFYNDYFERLNENVENLTWEKLSKFEDLYWKLNNLLVCNPHYILDRVIKETIISEQLRKDDRQVLRKYLK